MWRKGNPGTLLVGMLISAAITENNMEAPQKYINYNYHTLPCLLQHIHNSQDMEAT
jgi:hypothetical protein